MTLSTSIKEVMKNYIMRVGMYKTLVLLVVIYYLMGIPNLFAGVGQLYVDGEITRIEYVQTLLLLIIILLLVLQLLDGFIDSIRTMLVNQE